MTQRCRTLQPTSLQNRDTASNCQWDTALNAPTLIYNHPSSVSNHLYSFSANPFDLCQPFSHLFPHFRVIAHYSQPVPPFFQSSSLIFNYTYPFSTTLNCFYHLWPYSLQINHFQPFQPYIWPLQQFFIISSYITFTLEHFYFHLITQHSFSSSITQFLAWTAIFDHSHPSEFFSRVFSQSYPLSTISESLNSFPNALTCFWDPKCIFTHFHSFSYTFSHPHSFSPVFTYFHLFPPQTNSFLSLLFCSQTSLTLSEHFSHCWWDSGLDLVQVVCKINA